MLDTRLPEDSPERGIGQHSYITTQISAGVYNSFITYSLRHARRCGSEIRSSPTRCYDPLVTERVFSGAEKK